MDEALLFGCGVGVVGVVYMLAKAAGGIAQHLGQLTAQLAETEDRRRDEKERADWPSLHRAP